MYTPIKAWNKQDWKLKLTVGKNYCLEFLTVQD